MLPTTRGKKKKPPGKVYSLRELCSQRFGDQPDLVMSPSRLMGSTSQELSPDARRMYSKLDADGDLEGWLRKSLAAQQVAVNEALTKHQNQMLQQLLGTMDGKVSPSSVTVSSTKDLQHFADPPAPRSWECKPKVLHPVEPYPPPLPTMPPLPNQLTDQERLPSPLPSPVNAAQRKDGFQHLKKMDNEDLEKDRKTPGELELPDMTSVPLERNITVESGAFGAGLASRRASASATTGASKRETTLAFRKAEDLLDQLKMPFWHPGRVVRTTQFDAFICAVIMMLNTLVMAFESQYLGLQRGYDLGFEGFTLPASEEWPYADLGFYMVDYVFGVIYLIEICIKICGLKCSFFKDPWNYFDSSLVLFWIIEKALSAYAVLDQGLLRVLRMGRVLRLLRLVKTIQGFDALYIMTTAMQGSVTVLFWSFVLLMVVQTLIAFTLNQALDSYFRDKTKPVHQQHQVFEYFGTAGRAMFTMFELTLANWPTAARILQENVTEYYAIFSVAYKLIIGFAAVGIINAVFMQETFKVAASDDKLMMRQKERDRMLHTKKMRTLFAAADESGDGVLDQDEFREIMTSPDIRMWLAAQELPIRDPDVLWKLLDDGDAELTADELVHGVERLKGTAKGIDLAAFIMEHRTFQQKICEKLGIEEENGDDDDD